MLNAFYSMMNRGYGLIFGNRYMLHAPLFLHADDSLFDAQCNFCDYCMSFLPPLTGKRVLDIGCGNGMQTMHLLKQYQPYSVYGIDVVASQIAIAIKNADRDERAQFATDDAQWLATVADRSFDVVICMESALHYPDKEQFLSQVKRVLAPDGIFLIADLLKKKKGSPSLIGKKFHLFNWSHDQYLASFKEQQFKLLVDRDMNDFLLPHFEGMYNKIKQEIRLKKTRVSWLMLLMAGPSVFLYTRQLKRQFRYRLFVGKND